MAPLGDLPHAAPPSKQTERRTNHARKEEEVEGEEKERPRSTPPPAARRRRRGAPLTDLVEPSTTSGGHARPKRLSATCNEADYERRETLRAAD